MKNNRLKRCLFTAALAATMTLSSVAPAFAGDITIHPGEYSSTEDTDRFTAYQIFSGTANNPEDPHSLTGIEWADGIDHAGFIEALKNEPLIGTIFKFAYSDWESDANSNKGSDAEMVARFIADHKEFAKNYARLFAQYKQTAKGTSEFEGGNWVIKGVPDGYYLIVDSVAEQSNESASSYILDVVGDEEINVKATIPTVDKTVEDTQKGNISENYQQFEFTLTGTVAENYDEYETYKYVFHDTLSAGLSYVDQSAKVEIDGTPVSTGFTVECTPSDNDTTSGEQTLTVTFENLKTLADVDVTSTSTITVTYQAKLNKHSTPGSEGNLNSVTLEFSNDPYSEQTGQSTPETTKTYEFGLDITKYNGTPEEKQPLQGAKFKLMKDGQYAVLEEDNGYWSIVSWVADEGSATAVETQEGGKLKIKGLGKGTYTLKETEAPTGFDLMDDISFTVDGTVGEDGSLQSVSTNIEGTRDDASVQDSNSDGILEMELVNYESSVLPHTGGAGTTALYMLSITVGIAGIAGMTFAFRKKNRKEEEK